MSKKSRKAKPASKATSGRQAKPAKARVAKAARPKATAHANGVKPFLMDVNGILSATVIRKSLEACLANQDTLVTDEERAAATKLVERIQQRL